MTLAPVPRFLPAPLINARAAVMNRLYCQDLSQTARQVLYGVLAFFKLGHPEQPVFASRETLQAETLLSSRSKLFRGLQEAEDKGYIRRAQVRTWGKRCYGQFSRSHIYLLDKALTMLGLAAPRTTWSTSVAAPGPWLDDVQPSPGSEAPSPAVSDALPCARTPGAETSQEEIIEAWEASRTDWQDDETGWEADTPPPGAHDRHPVRHLSTRAVSHSDTRYTRE